MPGPYLFIPFPKDLVESSDDGYVLDVIEQFKTQHPEGTILYPSSHITWSKEPPSCLNFNFFTQKIRHIPLNPLYKEALGDQTSGLKPGPNVYMHDSTLDDPTTGSLVQVPRGKVLCVLGHSSFTGGWLALKVNHGKHTYRHMIHVDLLAQLLKKEGLFLFQKHIKLLSCFGGGSDASDVSLAKELAKQLGALGFGSVCVGGYQHPVSNLGEIVIPIGVKQPWGIFDSSFSDSKKLSINPFPDVFGKEDDLCFYFDVKGKCVRAGSETDIDKDTRLPVRDPDPLKTEIKKLVEWFKKKD